MKIVLFGPHEYGNELCAHPHSYSVFSVAVQLPHEASVLILCNRVSEIGDLGSATKLSGNKTVEVEILSNHNRFGCLQHDSNTTSAEPETVASLANPWQMPRSSVPASHFFSPTQVQRKRSGLEVRIGFLKSSSETLENPLSALGGFQSASDSTTLPTSSRSPHISSILGETRHGECLSTVQCPNPSPTSNVNASRLSLRPAVTDSGDHGGPEPANYAPRLTNLEDVHVNQVLVDDARWGNASPEGSYIITAQADSDSRYATTVSRVADSWGGGGVDMRRRPGSRSLHLLR